MRRVGSERILREAHKPASAAGSRFVLISPAPLQDLRRGGGTSLPVNAHSIVLCRDRDVDDLAVEAAGRALAEVLGLRAVEGPPISLPDDAYRRSRDQYLADRVLEELPDPGDVPLCLGMVAADLFVRGLNFVFGLAHGRRCLVSTARLDPGPGHPGRRPRLLRRVAVEAVHEVGHLLGYAHCTDPACAMHFSHSLTDTDRKGPGLCPACRAGLTAHLSAVSRSDARCGPPRFLC